MKDKRVTRATFIELYEKELKAFFEEEETAHDESEFSAHIYGYPISIQWKGFYCDCDDGAPAYNCIITELKENNKLLVDEVLEDDVETYKELGKGISRKEFIKRYEKAVDDDVQSVFGYPFTIHWNGLYCIGCDGSYGDEFVLPMIKDIIEECGNDGDQIEGGADMEILKNDFFGALDEILKAFEHLADVASECDFPAEWVDGISEEFGNDFSYPKLFGWAVEDMPHNIEGWVNACKATANGATVETIETNYSEEADRTFIMKCTYKGGELIREECIGFYSGEPDEANKTEDFLDGGLVATYEL